MVLDLRLHQVGILLQLPHLLQLVVLVHVPRVREDHVHFCEVVVYFVSLDVV